MAYIRCSKELHLELKVAVAPRFGRGQFPFTGPHLSVRFLTDRPELKCRSGPE